TCPKEAASATSGPRSPRRSLFSRASRRCLRPPSIASTRPRPPCCARATRSPFCRRSPGAEGRPVYLTSSPIDVDALLREARASDGALCLCLGVWRNESEGRPTTAIEYQAYGPMAESEIAKIADGLTREFPAVRTAIRHRVGRLSIGDASVAIAAV